VTSSDRRRATLCELNRIDRAGFVAIMGDTVENAPWVAELLMLRRPFATVEALWRAIMETLSAASDEARLALFRGHPELAGSEAVARRMSSHSTREQDRLGLTAMQPAEMERLHRMNRRYRERFGYPCIVALRHQRDLAGLLESIVARLANDPATEREHTLREIGEIVRGRLDLRIAESEVQDG